MTTTKTLSDLLTPDTFRRVLDRSENVDDIAETARQHWQMDISQRKPGPALVDPKSGSLLPTDLDLLCLFSTLAARKAKVFMPTGYKSQSPTHIHTHTSQQVVSDTRMGPITGVVSNADYFAFGFTMNDQAVLDLNKGDFGAYRTFRITGKDGRWHPLWMGGVNFVPDARENEFVKEFSLAGPDGSIAFEHVVHPSRRASFFGQHYALTKLLIQRFAEESKGLRAAAKAATSPGVSGGFKADESTDERSLPTRTVRCPIFHAEVDAPFVGSFLTPSSPEVAKEDVKFMDGILRDLRFAARATEYAFYKTRGEAGGVPVWADPQAFSDNVPAGTRTVWRRMEYGKTFPLLQGMALRYRIRAKDEKIAVR